MEIKTLEQLSIDDQVKVFNEAFSDYVIQFTHTAATKSFRAQRARVELKYSVGIFDQGQIVAFIFAATGTRYGHQTIYNAGTGVIPSYRGQRLVKKMYDFALPIWQAAGFTQTTLEVIKGNTFAIKAYESVGLSIMHELISYSGELSKGNLAPHLSIHKADHINWAAYEPLQAFEYSWDFCQAGVDAQVQANQAYELYNEAKELQAFAIVNTQGQIAQAGASTPEGYQHLFTALAQEFQELKWINIHQDAQELMAFLESIGWQVIVTQFEMCKIIMNYEG